MGIHWLEILLLLLSVVVTGGVVILLNRDLHKQSKYLLSFSGAFLLGLCILGLIPYVYGSSLKNPGLWIIAGFIIQILLEYISSGIEHGHFHSREEHDHGNFPVVVMISLGLHAFFEGMPFGGHVHDHHHSLLVGIILHKVPVALVLASMMIAEGFSRFKAFMLILIFGLASPVGAIAYAIIGSTGTADVAWLGPAVNGLLIGILLHVSTTIIFESSEGHRFNRMKFLTIILGLTLAFFSS